MKFIKLFLIGSLFLITQKALAQDHSGHMNHDGHTTEADTTMQMQHESMMMEPSILLSRFGSGTGWLPDAAPRYGYMFHTDEWMFMVHGNVFGRYTNQDIGNEGTRGDEKFGSTNWLMGMGQTRISDRSLFRFNIMLSAEPLTVGGAGYPLLFQTGETWDGKPLVDHQHPHDIISELAVTYSYKFSDDVDGFVYFGYPGEPALGPVAFMHRPSGIYNPNTPLGHHWQDATHVTFGVATLGLRWNDVKVDGSIFTGTEPNEDRYGFDEPRFNSYSLRVSYNPTENWSMQVSRGWLNDVHAIGPREDVTRTTASVLHSVQLGSQSWLNSAAVWGYNDITTGHHPSSHSVLLESALTVNKTSVYSRFEWVEKTASALLLDEAVYPHDNLYDISALSLGLQQKLFNTWNTNVALGVQGRLYFTPDQLEAVYGDTPIGFQVYLRVYPGRMMH